MKNICLIEILLIAVLTISLTVSGTASTNISNNNTSNVTSVTYHSDVDQDYGFYRVIDYTAHKPSPYVNNTLTINIGDTVVWVNDAKPDWPLTIISKEGLWDNRSAYLRWNYQRFSYTFNESGTYDVYIKEYPREQHQIIIVKGMEPIVISTPTVITTDTEIPPTEITPTEIDITKKTQDLTIVWVLIIAIGMIMYAIYELRKRKKNR